MKTLGERLEKILRWLDINQSEAGVRTGISKATISHLIRNKVETYKNSSVIAEGLNVNHDWLVYGYGGILNPTVYYLPIIHEYFRLRLYQSEAFLEDNTNFVVSEQDYGKGAFATILNNELLICSQPEDDELPSSTLNYLIWTERRKAVVNEFLPGKRSFIIHELRKYNIEPIFMRE